MGKSYKVNADIKIKNSLNFRNEKCPLLKRAFKRLTLYFTNVISDSS